MYMLFGYIQFITWIISNVIGRFFLRLEVKGLENIKDIRPGGHIFAANHEGAIDPFLIGAALPRSYYKRSKALRFLTYYKYITLHWYGFFIWLSGAFPVFPGRNDIAKSTAATIRLLQKNHDILIFPPAKRQPVFHPAEARQGVGYIAERTKGLITPVYITGTHKLTFFDAILRKRKVKVVFGPELNIIDLKKPGEAPSDIARKIMERVRDLQEVYFK